MGSARNSSMRRERWESTVRNFARTLSSGPTNAAGSSMPQCAVTGLPGQLGHCSAAALSHTVKMKSICGAPGVASSSQLLLRSPSTPIPSARSASSAWGFTTPVGWLPAEKAWNRPLPMRFSTASAMMLRAEFPVHRKSTL